MPYASSGTLTTDEREVAISETWDSQTDWTAYQSATNVDITNGVVSLADRQFIDNYEDAPDGIYQSGESLSDYYGGVLSAYERTQQMVIDGSHTLYAPAHSQNDYIASVGSGGVGVYPSKGQEFSALARPGTSSGMETCFATPTSHASDNLGYCIRLATGSQEVQMNKRFNGFTGLSSTSASLTPGNDYEIVVEWHDGTGSQPDNTIVATVYNWDGTRGSEVASTSVQDSEGVGNGGIAVTEGGTDQPDNRWDTYRIIGSVP